MRLRASVQVTLPGGLGNQLFAVVFCLNLLQRGHKHVSLSARHYRWYDDHEIEIASLIESLSASTKVPQLCLPRRHLPLPLDQVLVAMAPFRMRLVEGKVPLRVESVLHESRVTASGYYQDSALVDNLGDEFLHSVTRWLESPPASPRVQMALGPSEMDEVRRSTVVHLRRGNFRRSPTNGVLDTGFIVGSLNTLGLEEKDVLLLSDDEPEMLDGVSRALARFGYPTRIIRNGHLLSAYESLRVLSSAKSLVLANSTLSWWAARLNLDRPIVQPSEWLRSTHYRPNLQLFGVKVQPVSYESLLSTEE